jgi:hypothetical protein
MKRILIIIFCLNVSIVYCQSPCDGYPYTFEDTTCMDHIFIDTVLYHSNIWQVGNNHKSMIDTIACESKVIMTDTINPYPVNNTSIFTFSTTAALGVIYGCLMFQGNYYVQTDTLKDYGKIEFSPDNGSSWIDIINDTTYTFGWSTPKPVLTGHSHSCKYFDVLMPDLGSVFNIHMNDTIKFRFTFTSDSTFDNLGGLMFDNLIFMNFVEGISEARYKPIKSVIFPNPSSDIFTIKFDNLSSDLFELSVYDIHSKPLLKKGNIAEDKVIFSAASFGPGIYIYKLTDPKTLKRSWGKFIVTK